MCWLCYRRTANEIFCNTTASLEGLEKVKVTVQIDKAKIPQELIFEYVEDPKIIKLEPEWSIFRYCIENCRQYLL